MTVFEMIQSLQRDILRFGLAGIKVHSQEAHGEEWLVIAPTAPGADPQLSIGYSANETGLVQAQSCLDGLALAKQLADHNISID